MESSESSLDRERSAAIRPGRRSPFIRLVQLNLIIALALLWPHSRLAAEQPVPLLTGPVLDQTASLTTVQAAALEQTLLAFAKQRGSQVAVLIVATTEPETVEQYALRVVESWRLGRSKVDDGVLLLVAKNDRTVRIEVGYGLEGAVTDLKSKQIIEDIIIPRFKSGDFYGGVSAGVDAIIKIISGEELVIPKKQAAPQSGALVLVFFLAAMGGGLLSSWIGKIPAGAAAGALTFFFGALAGPLLAAFIAALLLFFIIGFGQTRSTGRRSSWSSTSSRGGSSSGGGFSGGGGSFGGGGASGRW